MSPRLISVLRRPSDCSLFKRRLSSDGRIPGCARINESTFPSRLRKNAVSSALSGLGDPALACRPHGGDRIVRRGGRARIEASSYRLAREIAHPDQVVHGQPKGKHPAHPRHPAMAGLAQQANLFEPAEDLFDALTLPLAHQVAAVPRGAAIDRTRTLRGVLGHMRGYREAPEAVHEIPRVIALVGAERGP